MNLGKEKYGKRFIFVKEIRFAPLFVYELGLFVQLRLLYFKVS